MTTTNVITPKTSLVINIISLLFALLVFAAGIINTFWGNDLFFGIFLILLSFIYVSPVDKIIKSRFGFTIPLILKLLLAVFIIWASLGVGELFDKIELMRNAL